MKLNYLILIIALLSSAKANTQNLRQYLDGSAVPASAFFHNSSIYYAASGSIIRSNEYGIVQEVYRGLTGTCIGVDVEGKIWAGDRNNALKYYKDGQVVTYLNYATYFIEDDKKGALWIGLANGLLRVNKDGAQMVSNELFSDIAFSSVDNSVWLTRQDGGIYKLNGNNFTLFSYNNYTFNFIELDAKNNVYVTLTGSYTNKPLFKFDGYSWSEFQTSSGEKISNVYSLAHDSYNKLYALSHKLEVMDSLLIIENDHIVKQELPKIIGQYSATLAKGTLKQNGVGNICILDIYYNKGAEYPGVFSLNHNKWNFNLLYNETAPYFTQAFARDKFGRIWFGGLSNFGYISSERFNMLNDWITWINDIEVDNDGRIWYGGSSSTFGYYEYEKGVTKLDDIFPLSTTIHCVLCDKQNKIWVGTSIGVYTNRNGSWDLLTSSNGLQSGEITALSCDDSNSIYFGSNGQGISVLSNNGSWSYISSAEGLQTINIVDMVFDHEKRLWVLASNSLSCLSNNSWVKYSTSKANSLSVDSKNRILVSTGSGLYAMNNGSWSTLYYNILSNNIRAAIEDGYGNIWFGGGGSSFYRLNVNYNTDFDGDGISNLTEPSIGTNPFLMDSDNDGLVDGSDNFPLDQNKGVNNIWHADSDGDLFGNYASSMIANQKPVGFVLDRMDCNDSDPSLNPMSTWYPDADNDGYGNESYTPLRLCSGYLFGLVRLDGDCNDQNSYVYPGAPNRNEGIDNNCDGVIDSDERNSTALEFIENNHFMIFPNPSSGSFNIVLSHTEASAHIFVYNTLGTLVYSSVCNSPNTVVDLSFCPKGLYCIEVEIDLNTFSQKVLIK